MQTPETPSTPSPLNRIEKMFVVAGVVGLILGLVASAIVGFGMAREVDEPKYSDVPVSAQADSPPLLGLIAFPILGGLCGVATAVMFAPASYFTSDRGQAIRKFVGTENVLVARLVCFCLFLFGAGLITFLIIALLTEDFKKPLFG